MDNLLDKVDDIEKRLSLVEQILGISTKGGKPTRVRKEKEPEPEPEETIGGFTKSQLRVMFNWAKGTKLSLLSKGDFEELKKWGMLKDFYPDAPDNYEDIKL